MWSVLLFFQYDWGEQHSSVCDEGFGQGSRQARKQRTAVVKAWHNQWGDQFHCSLGGKILPDRTNSTELVVAGYGGLTDEVLHGQCAVEENAEAFDWVRERDCGIVKLKGVDSNRGQFFFFYDRFQAASHHTHPMCHNDLCKSFEVKVVTRGPLFCVVRATRASWGRLTGMPGSMLKGCQTYSHSEYHAEGCLALSLVFCSMLN